MDEVDGNSRCHLIGHFLLRNMGGNSFKEYRNNGGECDRNELWPAGLFQPAYDFIFCRFYTYSQNMGKTN
jgi:hypothetical protein